MADQEKNIISRLKAAIEDKVSSIEEDRLVCLLCRHTN